MFGQNTGAIKKSSIVQQCYSLRHLLHMLFLFSFISIPKRLNLLADHLPYWSTIFWLHQRTMPTFAQELHNSQIYDKQQIKVPYLHADEFSSYGWDSTRWSMRLLFHCNESKESWASCTRFPFPHEDNNLSHLLFSSAFHSNDRLLSSCILIITSRGGLYRWFTSSVKNLIWPLSISFSYQLASLLSSFPLLNAWKIARNGPLWPTYLQRQRPTVLARQINTAWAFLPRLECWHTCCGVHCHQRYPRTQFHFLVGVSGQPIDD